MQRKKKRSIIFELHSIPINIRSLCKKACSLIRFSSGRVPRTRRHGSRPLILGRDLRKPSEKVLKEHSNFSTKRLYLVSYSIPLSCIVALLLGLGMMINPSNASKTHAVEVTSDPPDDSFSDFAGIDDGDNSGVGSGEDSEDDEYGIMPLKGGLDTTKPPLPKYDPATIGLTISDTNQTIQAIQGGDTVYGSYAVSMSGGNIKDYTLSIQTDSANLVMPSGANASTSTISGVGSATGSSMTANKWGYAIAETTTNNYANLTYKTVPTSATSIATTTVASPYTLSANKKLVFAAKFGDSATPGQYSSKITLSLAATPAETGRVWSNGTPSYITAMQDIDSNFCASSIPVGSTITLSDNRGSIPDYKIIKMGDGTCWMAENLRLTEVMIDYRDSDMTEDSGHFYFPDSETVSDFTNSNQNTAQVRYDGDTTYGAYYNYYTATAGSAPSGSGDAPNSICPKGWKLPAYDGTGSFINLKNNYISSWTTVNGKNGYKMGYNSNDAFWPAAGSIYSGSISSAGSTGGYWSRRVYESDLAYGLYFESSYVYPQYKYVGRYIGYSVRCVANY